MQHRKGSLSYCQRFLELAQKTFRLIQITLNLRQYAVLAPH